MKLVISALLLTGFIITAAPSAAFADDDFSCATDNECQKEKIEGLIALEKERDREPAASAEDSCAVDDECQRAKIEAMFGERL